MSKGQFIRMIDKAKQAQANAVRFNFDGTMSCRSMRRAMKWWRKFNRILRFA